MEAMKASQWVRPRLTAADACVVAAESFGLTDVDASRCKELLAYEDQNWFLETGSGVRYVLKIHNSSLTAHVPAFEAQNSAMVHLAQAGIACPQPVPCIPAAASAPSTVTCTAHVVLRFLPISGPGAPPHCCRVLHWVPGRLMIEVPLTPSLQHSLGAFMGRVSLALRCDAFDPPALRFTHEWRQEQTADTLEVKLPLAAKLFNEEQMSILDSFLSDWRSALPSLLADLPSQACHGDANERNVLVDETGSEVTGLIDFGDMVHTWSLTEAANTCLYAMLLAAEQCMAQLPTFQHPVQLAACNTEQHPPRAHDDGNPPPSNTSPILTASMPVPDQAGAHTSANANQEGQPPGLGREGKQLQGQAEGEAAVVQAAFTAGRQVLAGFESQRPLSAAECLALPLLVSARCCVSLVNGAAAAERDRSNAEYVLATQRPGWRVLRSLEQARRRGPGKAWLDTVP